MEFKATTNTADKTSSTSKYNKLNEQNIKEFNSVLVRRRPDGSLYKSRKEMIDSYNKSLLPYPVKAIFKLDYCNKIISSHMKQSIVFSIPISFVVAYVTNPSVRTKGLRSKGFSFYLSAYIITYISFISYFMVDSLIFCDYCKPWSQIYSEVNDSKYFKEILVGRIKSEQSSQDAKIKKTKSVGLKDDEL